MTSDGDALLSLGASGVIFVATRRFRPNPARAVHASCHFLPEMWHQMSVHLSAAACIDWAARLTGSSGPAAIFALAEAASPAAGPELFLSYLSGERTPHNDPFVRGAFLGLDHDTDPGRLAASVLEGVAFAMPMGSMRCARPKTRSHRFQSSAAARAPPKGPCPGRGSGRAALYLDGGSRPLARGGAPRADRRQRRERGSSFVRARPSVTSSNPI